MAHQSARHPRESGYGHWRWQRISAVITLILMVYFTYLMASLGPLNYQEARSFVATPHQGIALGFLLSVGLFHATLGVQMIIEDYIPLASGRLMLVMVARAVFTIASLAGLVAVGHIMGWV
ncbi:MAG: succinate dehydrogenase, hydrophobic membrane anchor protein [Candidatus Puniceispirillaceae bacterium]